MAEMNHSSCYSQFCETIAKMKCDKCFGALTPVTNDESDNQPIVHWCEECNIYYGLDDSYSEEQCREWTEFLQSALDNGILRAKVCPGCGNDDLNKYMFEYDEDQRLSLRCMVCRHLKVLADTRDDTADNQTKSTDDPFPIVCDCGNNNPDIFKATVANSDEDITIFQCLVCDATFAFRARFEKEARRPSDEKLDTGGTFKDNKTPGQPSGCTDISHVSELLPGDHIYWNRSLGYSHHAIVVKVNDICGRLKVIHYQGGILENKSTGSIQEEWLDVDCRRDPLYRQDYSHCSNPEQVIQRARSRLGERCYNLLLNNCEHFARWCKTGVSESAQVDDAVKSISRTQKNISLARKFGHQMHDATKDILKLDKPVFDMTGLAATELLDVWSDSRKAYKQMVGGYISRAEFHRVTVERAASGLFAVLGALPVAVMLNNVVGMTLAAAVGRGLSKIVVRQAQKLITRKL